MGHSHVHSEKKRQTEKNVCSDKRRIPSGKIRRRDSRERREGLKEGIVLPVSKYLILFYDSQENSLLFVILPTISILTD